LSRWECAKVKEAYDRGGNGKTLEQALKTVLKGHYLMCCLTLISGDLSLSPLGSDKEEGEDEAEAEKEGERARKVAEVNYRKERMMERGEQILRDGRYYRRGGGGGGGGGSHRGHDDDDDGDDNNEEDEYQSFYWDIVKGRFMDMGKLVAQVEDARDALQSVMRYKTRLIDEIAGTKDVYFAITKHCYETETWIRILSTHVKCLTDFVARRDKAAAIGGQGVGSQKKTR
jgi:hypothetical protein